MRIGLVPMSAKPFHRGHAGLIEIAAKENDKVIVFVGLGSRGIKKRKKQKRKFEEPLAGEFPIYGDTMKKIWQGYDDHPGLADMMKLAENFQNVKFIFPGEEYEGDIASAGPIQSVINIFLSLIMAKSNDNTLKNVRLPFLGEIDQPGIYVYSDPDDTQQRYNRNGLALAVRSSLLKVNAKQLKDMSENDIIATNKKSLSLVDSVLNQTPGFNTRAVTRGKGTVDISGTRVRQLLQNLRINIDMSNDEYDSVLTELEKYLLLNSICFVMKTNSSSGEIPDGQHKRA